MLPRCPAASLVLAFPAGLGGDGIWWGMTAGLAAAGALLVGRVVRRVGERPGCA